MATWEEIKRLAADLERAQLSSTALRLSERNCVEIVQKLVQHKLIDVIYTTDGKEYLTPVELGKEIKEELIVHGGRINLVELQQILNVDYNHIEAKANEISKSDNSIYLTLGQLVDRSYLDNIAEEINDKLQEQGQITVGEVTKLYDLPREFLSEAISKRLGKTILGQRDEFDKDVIFTEAFVERHRAKIRGAFSAVTRPVNISNIMQQFHLQERLFYSVLEDLVHSGRLAGSISGGRQDKAQYIPDIYSRSQNEWIDNFFKQNGYLEYDGLTRLGVSDPKAFIKKRFKGEKNLLYLSTCCASATIQDNLESQMDEGLASVGWIDVMPLIPSVFSTSDSLLLLQKLLKTKPNVSVYCDCIVASKDFIDRCTQPFDKLMQTKAESDVKANPALLSKAVKGQPGDSKDDKKDGRRGKITSTKSGGGTQGREIKVKATKKKYMKGRGGQQDEESDDEGQGAQKSGKAAFVEFLTPDEITRHLQKFDAVKKCPEEFIEEISTQIHRPLQRQYQEVVKSVFLQSLGGATSSGRKKTHGDLSEKLNGLWTNVKLFEKAVRIFPEENQVILTRHLQKTVCTDVVNLVFNTVAADHMLSVKDETTITTEVRQNMLLKLPDGKTKTVLTKLNSSLASKDLGDFFREFDDACGSQIVDVLLKKPDKKKERQLVFNHKMALVEQLKNEEEPAMALHLAATLLFNVVTQCVVHAPGRFVPQIITFLKAHLPQEASETLVTYQDLVVQQLKQSESDDLDPTVSVKLSELLPQVKDIAFTTKKSTATTPTED